MTARWLGLAAGIVMILLGGLWTFQGLGYVGGSFMTGSKTWAILGPVVAGFGVALVVVTLQKKQH